MIIVSGWIRVDSEQRDAYLATCTEVIELARAAAGCVDFHIAGDPLEADRINVFEQWESTAAVEEFRASGPSDDQQDMILGAHVEQHEVASTTSLT
ncbi:putative quinol monooxygenase [Ilumatobacter nonamiensis]|uniref:putative quinol monooxygenase n=1 Tax=Ilumatobacter nonamiensis TaxID=467093 RepID=UPI00034D744C|nr:antibiotic biosynthesis monooxygenase [Ilumatobacter nonamiensis]